ncbi:hypothetical protein VTN77DRAFT_1263 [Rasamsonia byssochlamydoides]|uniref:uncharacterized protein n=1 Tax=Rasamsonia byssochlamydoides TaxID=89139 RepID=UPI0037446808
MSDHDKRRILTNSGHSSNVMATRRIRKYHAVSATSSVVFLATSLKFLRRRILIDHINPRNWAALPRVTTEHSGRSSSTTPL